MKHPAQIQIVFSRVTSSNNYQFYGSDIEASSFIEMTISESSQGRYLCNDNHFAHKTILRARLTNLQFSDLITTLNMGDGTPATLTYLNTDMLPQGIIQLPPIKNKIEIINKEVHQELEIAENNLNDLQKEIEELKISKVKKESLLSKLNYSRASILRRVKFNIDMAKDEIVRMTSDAKGTIESFYTGLCVKLGVKSLKEQTVKMIDDK